MRVHAEVDAFGLVEQVLQGKEVALKSTVHKQSQPVLKQDSARPAVARGKG